MSIQPTRKRTTIAGIVIYWGADGRIAQSWFAEDAPGVRQQPGARSIQCEQ